MRKRDEKGRYISQGRTLKRSCEHCSEEFTTCQATVDSGKGRFCSVRCSLIGTKRAVGHRVSEKSREALIKRNKEQSGENHWNWKGGITQDNYIERNTVRYRQWREAVYQRDGWTCQDCGDHCQKKNIVAHHIKYFSEYPELRYEVANGKTLCRPCHIEIHRPNEHPNHLANPN